MTLHRLCIARSVLLAWLCVYCNGSDPIEPAYRPNMDPGRLPTTALEQATVQRASTTGSGLTVKAPSATKAVAASESGIDVSWQDNSSNETGFEVHRSTSGVSGAFVLRASTGEGIISYSDLGLTPSTENCYKARALRTTGTKTTYSAFSTTACATTLAPPVPPIPLAASEARAVPGGSTAISVIWTDNSTNETGFRIERSTDGQAAWSTAATSGADTRSIWDADRTSEQQVCYRVIAFNSVGDSPASNTTCTAPPAAPTNLTATFNTVSGSDLTWTDNSNVEDAYAVYAFDGSDYVYTATLPANSTGYHSGFASGFIVHATKDGGLSDPSNVASCVGSDCPSTCPCALSEVCDWNGFCVPHCFDGLQNGGESDVDCGGDGCEARCAAGQACGVHADCASGNCFYGTCQP